MSIRLRLTLLYSFILALTLVVFSLVLYTLQAQVLYNALSNELMEDARSLVDMRGQDVRGSGVRGLWNGHKGKPPFAGPAALGQMLTLDGTLVFASTDLEGIQLPLSEAGWDAVKGGRAWREAATVESEHLYIYSTPILFQGRVTGVAQVARATTEQEASLAALRQLLIMGTILATLTAFGIGWAISGAALRPINRLTLTAQAIGAERDFGRRVEHTGPQDELGRLATTFNQMLSELQVAFHQIEHSLQTQRRFVADASHELRTPLTTIRGNLGLLQRDPPIITEDREAVLSDSVEETERLMRLVQGLLTLARADTGQALKTEPVAVQATIDDVVRQTQRMAPEHKVMADNVADLVVRAERDTLKQVLLILLDNAVKYTPVGGRITVSAEGTATTVVIRVRDTGVGIPASALPNIFTRFWRADSQRTGGGAGLGLSIAKSLVEAYHGSISVDSVVGQGSVFTVTLPAYDATNPI